jgi:phosphoribosylamine--glycine ligase
VDVGSENPLEEGLIDVLNQRGIRSLGPKKEFVRLESDRAFTDDLLSKIDVPKPEYRVFDDPAKAKEYVRNIGYQVVVKANGLAAGKGAIVCQDAPEAEAAVEKIMVEKIFGDSGNRVVIEERKYGTEISFFVYLDGKHAMPLRMFAQDYKPAFDPDDAESIEQFGGNLNTGGTGCYCPHKLVSPWLVNRIIKEIVNPTVNAVYNQLGWEYKGVLYFGLNLDPYDNLDVFEINVRHGDPEWEVLARKLSTDLFEIGTTVWDGTLDTIKQVWIQQYYVDVIAMEGRSKAARGWNKGYPGRYGKGHRIVGLDEIGKGIAVYFAGVEEDQDKGLVTFGGRVLHVVAGDLTLEGARDKAYKSIRKIAFLDHYNNDVNCMRFRESIGL